MRSAVSPSSRPHNSEWSLWPMTIKSYPLSLAKLTMTLAACPDRHSQPMSRPMPPGRFRDLPLSFFEVFLRGLVFALGFAGQIGVARQGLPHPERGQLGVVIFGGDGGALQRGLSAFGAVVTGQNFLKHGQIPHFRAGAGGRGSFLFIFPA